MGVAGAIPTRALDCAPVTARWHDVGGVEGVEMGVDGSSSSVRGRGVTARGHTRGHICPREERRYIWIYICAPVPRAYVVCTSPRADAAHAAVRSWRHTPRLACPLMGTSTCRRTASHECRGTSVGKADAECPDCRAFVMPASFMPALWLACPLLYTVRRRHVPAVPRQ
jgi:hypothetical protein